MFHQETRPGSVGQNFDFSNLSLRAREAAKSLGISERTLWEWTKQGEVPHVKVGKVVLYPVAALKSWLIEKARGSVVRDQNANQ